MWIPLLAPAPGFPIACADYACDSAVVRLILDANGRQDVEVAGITLKAGGRITALSMQYLGLAPCLRNWAGFPT